MTEPNFLTRFKPGFFTPLVLFAILVDQISKILVVSHLTLAERLPLLPFLSFYRTQNDGVAFSFFSGAGSLPLIILAVVVLIFVSWLWQSLEGNRPLSRLGFALVWGGAVGNVMDRIRLGHVIDFISVHTQNWYFAIFNLADSFISLGAAAIILDEYLHWRAQNK